MFHSSCPGIKLGHISGTSVAIHSHISAQPGLEIKISISLNFSLTLTNS